MGSALAIVVSGARYRDEIVAFKEPVHLSKAVPNGVRMPPHQAAYLPMPRIVRVAQREGSAGASRFAAPLGEPIYCPVRAAEWSMIAPGTLDCSGAFSAAVKRY